MAKEMMIIFVYDTEISEASETESSSAIVYFHPNWVSDQQKTSLCGQIIGTAHCLKTIFRCPRILALQSGKFCICDYGRYILVVGSDRNIADWVLEYRTHILSSFITFFHKDLQFMAELYQNNNFSTKLYYMLETYLNVLMYGGNMFFNVPSIQLPKSASNVFLEAIQILQSCQRIHSVLGGTILYHNKVVATQLTSSVTKSLILTDPYRIKSPAETVKIDFQLPTGMQMLQVYIQEDDYQDLKFDAARFQSVQDFLQNKNLNSKTNQVKEPVLMTMKRDQSLIFTTVPEEGSEHVTTKVTTTKTQRPKFLNLKSKTTDIKQEVKETPSTFFNSVSVCSTPMTDLNRVLHPASLSICTNAEATFTTDELNSSLRSESLNSLLSATSDLYVEDAKNHSNAIDVEQNEYHDVGNNLKNFRKSLSLVDMENIKSDEKEEDEVSQKKLRRTIMDPTFPVFTQNGLLVSEHLYKYNILNGQLLDMKIDDNHSRKHVNKEELRDLKPAKANSITEQVVTTNNSEKPFLPSKENRKIKRSLTLPLKSLSNETNSQQTAFTKHSGVQLTPLLSKLSTLGMEEKSSGFCSIETTPSDFKDTKATLKKNNLFRSNSLKIETNPFSEKHRKQNELRPAVLLIYGQQDMVLNILLEDVPVQSKTIEKIQQISTAALTKLEKLIHCCLELCPGGNVQSETSDPYSYLCMNPSWDTIKKGGPWNSFELGALTHLHRDFINVKNITEILLRDDDGIIYAHNCGKTEVYYHQSAAGNAGLPTPVDPMSIIGLKAKRRLERDHGIILH